MNFESPNINEESNLDKLKKVAKKAILSATLVAGLSAGSGEAVAQNQDRDEDKIESVDQNNKYEKLVEEVDAKGLEKLLEGYDSTPGSMPLSMLLKAHKDKNFYVSEPTFSTIQSAAQLHSQQKMKLAGKLNAWPLSFIKKTSGGYSYITVTRTDQF